MNATNAAQSNFIGVNAGFGATSADYSNFMGADAGSGATGAFYSAFIGLNAGKGATGASNSTFIGYNAGNATQHIITGNNNIVIGKNITTPAAASTNTLNIGGVLFGTNLYSTTAGVPSKVAQTTGQIGINVTTPNASAALDVTSTTAGILIPRMTKAQRDLITQVAGLMIFQTDATPGLRMSNGTNWMRFTETID